MMYSVFLLVETYENFQLLLLKLLWVIFTGIRNQDPFP